MHAVLSPRSTRQVADFVRSQGRVSVDELAQQSNELINLEEADAVDVTQLSDDEDSDNEAAT